MASAKKVTDIISTLGGPDVNPEDIEWATDIPAGKLIIDWLASFLPEDTESECGDISRSEYVRNVRYAAALRDIALEKDEIDILRHLKVSIDSLEDSSDTDAFSTFPQDGWMPPSRLNVHANYIKNETRLVQQETELLKARLQQTKRAAHELTKTIKSIQAKVESTEKKTRETNIKLSELSLHTDSAIQSSTSSAFSLIDSVNKIDVTPYYTTLANFDKNLNALSVHTKDQLTTRNRIPGAEHVEAECSRLQAAFQNINLEEVEERAYREELEKIYVALENGKQDGADLEEIVRNFEKEEVNGRGDSGRREIDVKEELRRAWSIDQADLLDRRLKILEKANVKYQKIQGPAEELNNFLCQLAIHIFDAEALIGALGEEMEEVADDITRARDNTETLKSKIDNEYGEGETELEENIRQALKAQNDHQVLLDREDLYNALKQLVHDSEDNSNMAGEWTRQLNENLASLMHSHTPLLSLIYSNGTHPFVPPKDIRTLEQRAAQKSGELVDLVEKLQIEVQTTMENPRVQKRVRAFVDRWAGKDVLGSRS